MKQHNLQQGSAEWLAHRRNYRNASDAAAMLGVSPYKTRTELLREAATGLSPDTPPELSRLFAAGHRAEALARPHAEAFLQEDLYPCVATEGNLGASFDGLTMDESVNWEHKLLNADLRDCFAAGGNGDNLPLHHRVQMEHQMLVSRATQRTLFTASEWDAEGQCVGIFHTWYESDPELRNRVIAGWNQFEEDLTAFNPEDAQQPAERLVGASPESLPALRIEVTGMVRASNLTAFRQHALAVFAGINRTLSTDREFADAEATVKWCSQVEERLAAAKEHALSQTESIDALFKAIDDVSAEARRVRLELDRLVKNRKEAIRHEIANAAHSRVAEWVEETNRTMPGGACLTVGPAVRHAIGEAMRSKRTMDTLRNAADTVASGFISDYRQLAQNFEVNWKALGDELYLIPDFPAAGGKSPDDFLALLALRRNQHGEAVRQEAERQEAERAAAQPAMVSSVAGPTLAPAPNPAPGPAPTPAAPPPAGPPTLTLGALCDRLDIKVTAEFLASLGFEAHVKRAARLYHEDDFDAICVRLMQHIDERRKAHAQPAQGASPPQAKVAAVAADEAEDLEEVEQVCFV